MAAVSTSGCLLGEGGVKHWRGVTVLVVLMTMLSLCWASAPQSMLSVYARYRCVVCQNQSLADSNAPIAQQLRHYIDRMYGQGLPMEAIDQALVARYGNFILLKPPLNQHTWVLWFAPFAFLGLGLIIWWRRCQR